MASRNIMGVENDIFWSEIGSGFGEPGSTLPPRIPRSNPRTFGGLVVLKPSLGITFGGPILI